MNIAELIKYAPEQQLDKERCAECSYHGFCSALGGVICEYILCTGKLRGCPPGSKCDKFTTEPLANDDRESYNALAMGPGKTEPEPSASPSPAVESKPSNAPKIDKERLIQMKRAGKTDAECARYFGCAWTTLNNAKKRLIKEGRLPPTAENKREGW